METPRAGNAPPVNAAPAPPKPSVSIVIPAYNEARRLGPSLERILDFVDQRNLNSEVILVDDGSSDETALIASRFGDRVQVVRNASNHGKGYSVRRGMLESNGTWVLFTDADLSAPIQELDRLLEASRQKADIVIGSRAVDRSRIQIHQSRFREVGGIVYNWMAQLVLGLDIQDTQCGFKLFHREKTRPLFRAQTIDGFGFDPEILFLAKQRKLRVLEIPVEWSHDTGTKVRLFRDGLGMFVDLLRIRWRWTTRRYTLGAGNDGG